MREQKSFELFKRIHASDGMRFINQQHERSFSYNIFQGNMNELLAALGMLDNFSVGMKLMSENYREDGIQFHREANRLFHNFLASAMTLINHTRNFMKRRYKDMPVFQAYTQKVQSDLANDPLCRFIQELRNYLLHNELPHSSMSLKIERDKKAESTISIDIEKLLEWQEWSKVGRSYLENCSKVIKMSVFVSEYCKKIIEFHKWLDEALISAHKKQLDELEALQKLYQKLEGA